MRRLIGDVPVEFDDVGDGMPVLMLHGFTLDHRSLRYSLEPCFARRPGYRRLYVDLPGFGASPAQPGIGSSDAMLDFVLRLIDETVGESALLIVGESWGGYLARGVVSRRPAQVAGIALICPVIIATHEERDLPARAVLFEEPGLFEGADPATVEAFREGAVVLDRRSWDYALTTLVPAIDAADAGAIDRIGSAYAFSVDVDRVGDPFDRPSLIVVGRQDDVVGYRDALSIVDRYPRAAVAVLDAAGHSLEGERPEMIAALVGDWLDRVERT